MKITLTLLLVFISYSHAVAGNKEDIAINEFIKSELSGPEKEGYELQGIQLADLDNDNIKEVVFVWTLLGPTYWKNNLTVLRIRNDKHIKNEYVHGASLNLIGNANLVHVNGNKIVVYQDVYAPGDPRCCPSIEKKITYIFNNDAITREK